MYKDFYGLTRDPFDLTPDPFCFVPTARHNEALAALYYGIRKHKGVVVVTGEVGTGKTLLLRCLLQLFKESSEIAYAYVYNCRLTPTEFLYYTLSDFGVGVSGQNKSKLLLDLSKFVTSRGLNGLTTVLIVDEAHLLSMELLEEIRLLSNLETNDAKLLQIILVGQPELDEKLDSFELRPLKQRIALRSHLSALNFEETETYISERLRIAGSASRTTPIFAADAIKAIHQYSHGFPRLINTICENALINGYAKQLPSISVEVIKDVAEDFRLEANSTKPQLVHNQGVGFNEGAKNFILNLYAASQKSSESGPEVTVPIAGKAGEQ